MVKYIFTRKMLYNYPEGMHVAAASWEATSLKSDFAYCYGKLLRLSVRLSVTLRCLSWSH